MPDERLSQIFNENIVVIHTPDSRKKHNWFRTATALISKPLWESEVALLVKSQITDYYSKYRNSREYTEWLNGEINKENLDDRTKSALAQLYGLSLAPTQGTVLHEGLLGSYTTAPLESSEDNSLSAFVQDWTISRAKNPLSFFELVYRKLVSGGVYVITDRKPFKDLTDKHFETDGIARILEKREITNTDGIKEEFIIPKLFIKDLPKELQKDGFQIIYTSRTDEGCTYDIIIAVKSNTPMQQVSINDMVSSSWNALQVSRKKLMQVNQNYKPT